MAATPGTIATAQTGSNSRLLSWNHTVAADDTLLIVAMAANGENSDNRDITSLTVNGADATFISNSRQFSTGGGVARWIEGWYFDVTALNGTAAISVTYNPAGSTATIVGHSMTFKGTDPTTPLDLPAVGTSGSSSPISVTVPSATGDLVFSALSQRTGVATAYPSGATVTQTDSQTSGGVYASVAVQPGAASVTASYTTPSANHALFAVNINAASAGGGTAAPGVGAGADATITLGDTFNRTATESGGAPTSRSWAIISGPVASTGIGGAAALSWTPTVAGTYTLRYTASNAGGSSSDDVVVTVNAAPSGGGGGTGTTPTQVGTTTVAEASTGFTVVGTAPTGLAVGDFMVAFMGQKGSAAITAPSGWTLTPLDVGAGQVTSSTAGLAVMHKVATSADIGASWTFTAGVTDGVTVEITAWRGVDSTTAFDVTPVTATAGSSTSITVGPITTVTANDLLLYACVAQTTGSAITADAALTTISNTTGTGRRVVVAYEALTTAGASTARVYSSTSNLQKAAVLLALRPATATLPTVPTPTLTSAVVGISDPTVGYVKVQTSNATSTRLRATPVGGGTAIYGTAVTPSGVGASDLSVANLTSGLWYNWDLGVTDANGVETFITGGKFRAAPVGQTSFSFDFGSCTDATDSAAFAAIAARSSDFMAHVGDLYYADGSGTTVANMRAKMLAKVTVANHKAVFTSRPTLYTPSDHDGMNNNSTAGDDAAAWTNWNQVYREYFPSPRIPTTTGVYFTFVWGRVRFIVWDDRSFKSDKDNTDNSSKTALGAAQKQWTKDVITAATEPLIVILQSSPWIDTATASEDGWGGYITERDELGAFFTASGKNVIMAGGDMHAVAADDGTSVNAHGVKMMLQAAPFNNSASQKGGPYKVGPYPTGSASVQQYGHVDVTDNGSTITVAFLGLSSDDTQRVALSKTFAATSANFNGSVNLSGSGTVAAAGTPRPGDATALSGVGTLTGAGTPRPVSTGALSSTGTMTGAGTPFARGTAGLSGSGTLTGSATPKTGGTASLAGSGTLTPAGTPRPLGTTSLSGSGTVQPSGVPNPGGSVALSGGSSLGLDSSSSGHGTLASASEGTLSGTMSSMSATGAYIETGSGSLTASGVKQVPGSGSTSGSGTVTASGVPRFTGSVSLSGSGSLSATPSSMTQAGNVSLTGLGQLSGGGQGLTYASGHLDQVGTGTLTGSGTPKISAAAGSLSGSGSLMNTGIPNQPGTGSLSGSGTVSGTATGMRVSGSVALGGTGALSGTGAQTGATGSGALTGSGSLTSSGQMRAQGSINLSGSGTLSGEGSPKAVGSGSPSGSGQLTSDTSMRVIASLSTSGSGSIDAVGTPNLIASGSLSGSGTVIPAGAMRAMGQAALSASGLLSGAGTPHPTSAFEQAGVGLLAGHLVSLKFLGDAHFGGMGALTFAGGGGVQGRVNFSGTGTLIAQSAIPLEDVDLIVGEVLSRWSVGETLIYTATEEVEQ